MTREEKINEAVSAYVNSTEPLLVNCGEHSFRKGIDWADNNPKFQWISVEDDLPCNHGELMHQKEVREGTETIDVFAASKSGLIWNDYMMYENGKWRWNGNNFEPDFWMLAPKLPKE